MALTRSARPVSAAMAAALLCCAACAGEQPRKAFDLRPWQVGDKWVVQVNPREGGVRPDPEAEDVESLKRAWESDGKPKGIPFDEWLERREPATPAAAQETMPDPAADSPYDPWMRDDGPPDREHGPYSKEWVSWTFEVTAVEQVAGRRCFCVKATNRPAEDSAKGDADEPHIDENGELVLPGRRPKPLCLVYYFDAGDRSLVRIELQYAEGDKAPAGQQGFRGGDPVHASLDYGAAPPSYFPVATLGDYDRGKPGEASKEKQLTPNSVVSQKASVLDGNRMLITMADDDDVLNNAKGAKGTYAKFFFEPDLPWWTEGYVHALGGIRARLYSVNGKPLERRNLGVGGGEQRQAEQPRTP